MAELSDEEFEAAIERGRRAFETEPHARSAHFDPSTGRIVIDLYNGSTVLIPARQLQGLVDATDEDIGDIEISGFGHGLHWDKLDADFTVAGLVNGQFGTARFMKQQRDRLRDILTTLERDERNEAAE